MANVPEYTGQDFETFYNEYGAANSSGGWVNANPYSFGGTIQNWLAGTRNSAMDAYNKAQNDYQREYETWLSNTQYQRAIKDLYAAGFTNPHAILAGAHAQGAGMNINQSAHQVGDNSNKNGGRNLALTALAIAKIIAVLAA